MSQAQQTPNGESKSAGLALFEDIFRRADKDDNKIVDLEEFVSFFNDDALNHSILKQLFDHIDQDHNGKLDTEELYKFFSQGFKPHESLFTGLDNVNGNLSKLLLQTSKEYPKMSTLEQMRVRVYFREAANIMTSMSGVLDESITYLTKQSAEKAIQEGNDAQSLVASPAHEIDTAPIPEPSFDASKLSDQIDRFETVLGRWESVSKTIASSEFGQSTALRLALPEESNLPIDSSELAEQEEAYLVISKTISVSYENISSFKASYIKFAKAARDDPDCFYQYIRAYPDDPQKYTMYEVWNNAEDMTGHYANAEYRKNFERSVIDCSNFPATSHQIMLPQSWFAELSTSPKSAVVSNSTATTSTMS